MTTKKRIEEIWSYYVCSEPTTPEAEVRYKILRDRFNRILKSEKLRSIQIAMGIPQLPHQFIIESMTERMFEEFIGDNTIPKRRKEIYNLYSE